MLPVKGNETLMLEVRVVFDLVDAWWDGSCCEGGFELGLQIVGHAN